MSNTFGLVDRNELIGEKANLSRNESRLRTSKSNATLIDSYRIVFSYINVEVSAHGYFALSRQR